MKTKKLSYAVKGMIFLCAVVGLILNLVYAEADGYSSPSKRLLYFTNQSNIWVGALSAFIVISDLISKRNGTNFKKLWIDVLKLAFTVSITITGVVFCALLAPNAGPDYNPWTPASFLVHVATPVLAIADFFIERNDVLFKKRHAFISLIPLIYYFIFCLILYLLKVDFGRGDPFPYFFLNFGSPAGIFGFSDIFPYKIGTFYWLVLIFLFALSIAALYIYVYNRLNRKRIKQTQ